MRAVDALQHDNALRELREDEVLQGELLLHQGNRYARTSERALEVCPFDDLAALSVPFAILSLLATACVPCVVSVISAAEDRVQDAGVFRRQTAVGSTDFAEIG